MTIERLLECSAEELEKMTDAELEQHFKPLLVITRPELALSGKPTTQLGAPPKRPAGPSKSQLMSEREQKAREIASKFNLDIGDLFR